MTTLQLDLPETQRGKVQAGLAARPSGRAPNAVPQTSRKPSAKILRFAKSERLLHWCIAGPFLVSFASAIILVVVYNPDPSRPFRDVFAVLHRCSGVALIVLPVLATIKSRGDARLHFYNIRQAWIWVYDDFKWLALMGLAAINSKIELPEQGKFNAMEKINFMVLMTTYPLYVLTGLLMWITHVAVLAWLLHCFMAILAFPLIGGHIYMAAINPATRTGLEGMITGFVDRRWAKHHYRRWYREHHEASEMEATEESAGGHLTVNGAATDRKGPALQQPVGSAGGSRVPATHHQSRI